jgi:hypothetical protein
MTPTDSASPYFLARLPCRVFQLYRRVKVVPLRGLHHAHTLRFPLVGAKAPSSALRKGFDLAGGKTAFNRASRSLYNS